jgi:biotin synthase
MRASKSVVVASSVSVKASVTGANCYVRSPTCRSIRNRCPIDFVRTIAVARVLMPESHVRLSAGRTNMTDELQALCFFAGANSIFYGEQLLTTANPVTDNDRQLFERLGLSADSQHAHA